MKNAHKTFNKSVSIANNRFTTEWRFKRKGKQYEVIYSVLKRRYALKINGQEIIEHLLFLDFIFLAIVQYETGWQGNFIPPQHQNIIPELEKVFQVKYNGF